MTASKETASLKDRQRNFLATLASIVSPQFVASDMSTRYIYSQDLTENEPCLPVGVVMPETSDEVRQVVLEANRFGIPLVPFAYGLNMGGLTIPDKEAVVVDLKRMQAISEVNEDEMYIMVEPGVTFGMIRSYLDKHHPGYRYTYPLAPPQTSALSNALLDGLNNMSMKHGAMSEWISGMEVVLPTGELIRVGSCAIVDSWHSRAPLPDLAGLFLGWQGATGIVTRAALQIWPLPPVRKRFFFPLYETKTAYQVIQQLCRREIFDDLACVSWPLAKMLFGARGGMSLCQGEPSLFVYGDLYAESDLHRQLKEQIMSGVLKQIKAQGGGIEEPLDVDSLIQINPDFTKLAEFPTTLDFLLDYGPGGITWVGSYGPGSRWTEGLDSCFKILQEEDFPPILVSRPMKGGHFWVLRFILHFDKQNPKDIERTQRTLNRLGEQLLDMKYIPYKPAKWAVEKIRERDQHGFFSLLEKIKTCMDPNGILNPGRWGL